MPNLVYENSNFKLFSDKTPIEFKDSDVFTAVIGELFGSNQSDEKPSFYKGAKGNYLTITHDPNGKTTIETDVSCRLDLYYTSAPEFNCFSTDLDLILSFFDQLPEFDQVSFAHSLSLYGSRPPKQRTFHSGINRLGYRQQLIFNGNVFSVVKDTPEILGTNDNISETEFLSKYSQLFLKAIEERSSDNENIVLFSSGYDSTAITAALVKLRGKEKVKCLIGVMRYSKDLNDINEIEVERAKVICAYLGVELHITYFDYSELPKDLDIIIGFLKSNQLPSITAINHYLLAKFASTFAKENSSIFAGEMSDGAHNLGFAQFTSIFHPNSLDFREYADKMRSYLFGPSFLKFASIANLNRDPVWTYFHGITRAPFEPPSAILSDRINQFLISFFFRPSRMPFAPRSELRLLSEYGSMIHESLISKEYFDELKSYFLPENLYSLYIYLYNSFHWQGSTVNSLEIAGNFFGIRLMNPYHDNDFINHLSTMPENFGRGLDLKPTKFPLKWTLTNTLQYDIKINEGLHSYLYDVNPDFNHSETLLLKSSLKELFKLKLMNTKLIEELDDKIFNKTYIRNLISSYVNNDEIPKEDISNLISLSMHALIL